MSKHTPGPWSFIHGSKSGLARGIRAEGRNIVNFNGLASPRSEESQANASLIAAAPELLKVLEMVRDTLPHIGGNASSVHSMLRDISAAIAQAGGESNG